MLEKELLEKLNSLKNVKPDQEIVKKNRDILFSQILAGQKLDETKPGFFGAVTEAFSINFLVFVKQPAFITVALIVIVLTGGSAAGTIASKNAKPGDSLYIAKIISEKTRSTMTFNETDKAKLGVEFAGNRAKELSEVLAQPDDQSKNKEQKVAELSDNFKKEINQVKNRLEKINIKPSFAPRGVTALSKPSAEDSAAKKPDENKTAASDEKKIFRADTGKATSGIQIAEPEKNIPAPAPIDAKKTLEEAEKLFDSKDITGAIDKLEKVNEIIENKDVATDEDGQVKGESTSAGSAQASSTK